MTPCRFYFGCYIDTLCGRTLRNRMSGAAARHFFFLEKVRTVSACIGINLPLKNARLLSYLLEDKQRQILLFSCHSREREMLSLAQIPCHVISLNEQ